MPGVVVVCDMGWPFCGWRQNSQNTEQESTGQKTYQLVKFLEAAEILGALACGNARSSGGLRRWSSPPPRVPCRAV